jgi:hypothetical protein
MLLSENPIEGPARSYLKKVVDRMEPLQAELTITTKELEALKGIVKKRARQRSRKREIIKDKFLLSVGEVRDRLLAKEAEAAAKKTKNGKKKVSIKLNLGKRSDNGAVNNN